MNDLNIDFSRKDLHKRLHNIDIKGGECVVLLLFFSWF